MAALSAAALAAATRVRRLARRAGRDLAAFAWPQRCPSCGADASPRRLLCDACRRAIPPLSTALCTACLLAGREPAGCLRHPRHVAWAAWVYEERAACVVHALKFESRPRLARMLGATIARALPAAAAFDLVAGVPLHPARRRERGYDQAALLAEAVADAIGVPCVSALERVRATAPQARLDAGARRRNLDGAFAPRHAARLRGRRVLLVDDVLTTGATLAAAAATLARVGAEPTAAALAWAA